MLDSAQVENVLDELDLNDGKKSFLPYLPWYIWTTIAVLTVVLIGVIISYFLLPKMWNRKVAYKDPNIWIPAEDTVPAILGGVQSYTISGGTKGLPQITNLIVNPQDPKQGATQTVDVKVTNDTPVKTVEIVLHLDDFKDFNYTLKLADGTVNDGHWRISYPFPYTYNKAYRVTLKARNENNLGNMSTITIR